MHLTVTPPAIGLQAPMTAGAAATFVGSTRHLIQKVHEGGYLPDLRRVSLLPLLDAHVVSTATQSLPVAQVSPLRVASTASGHRRWVGDAVHLSDEQWVQAVRGDWNGSVDAVLAAGVLAIGLGGFITGLLRVTQATPVAGAGTNLVRFDAELLSRLTGPIGSVPHLGAPTGGFTPEERQLTEVLPGCRYGTVSGPCIGLI